MTSEERNTAVTRAIYGAYAKGDPGVLYDNVADDVHFGFAAKRAHFPFAGRHRGRAGVKRAIAHIAAQYEWISYRMREIIARGNRVVVLCDSTVRNRQSGRRITLELVDVIKFRRGKIVDFVEYFDSAAVLEAIRAPARKAAPHGGNVARGGNAARRRGR